MIEAMFTSSGFGMTALYAALFGYLLGSIPFGLILTRLAGKGDVRQIGSGNIGATNVLRTGSKGLAAATLLLDGLKGFVPVYLAARYWPLDMGWAALFAVLGHCFPVWLGFKGGKGVATNAGVSFGLAWPLGVAYALTWIAVLAITRISSLAGMTAVIAAVACAAVLGLPTPLKVLAIIAIIVIALHHQNLARLFAGTEPKVGGGKA